jgi:Meckel syndrome type 1 protein
MQHLDDGLLHELVDGEISSEQLGPIQRHLAECAACRTRLDAARDLAALTDGLIEGLDAPAASEETVTPVVPLPVRRPASQWSRGIGIAASLTLAVGVGWSARDLVPSPSGGSAAIPSAAPAPVLNAPADAVAASETPERETTPVLTAAPPSAPSVAEPVPSVAPETVAEPSERRRAPAGRMAGTGAPIEHREEIAPPAAQQATGARAASLRATGEGQRTLAEAAPVTSDARRQFPIAPTANALVPRDADQSSAKAAASPVVIEFAEAVALLGGRLRLIEGIIPSRLERVGDEVRVIYPISAGNLVLSQRRVGEELRWRLTAPDGYAADSLDALRRRVGP